ncbi:MAG: glyoxylase-like metal-dependent hydrolase (beta-lactamase superfamily II) [Arenicella sp.]|jgi:glyoxylase-like metal-dependent hydrolase (beta-lactamase superfamily II)
MSYNNKNKPIGSLSMKIWKKCVLALLILVAIFIIYMLLNIRSLSVEKISDDLHVIRGVGGNTTVLNTDAGAVVIDSMTFKMQGSLIREKAEQLTGKEVVLLVNTHYHLDHTHGNPGFKAGIQVVSTERTLSHLKVLDADNWQGDNAKLLPNDTFVNKKQFRLGNKTITLLHPGRGHTDGDLVVLFEEDKTVVTGDLFFNQHYPNIDLEAGGSVQAWPATIDAVLALDFVTVIPGHGDTSNREGLVSFQRMMRQLALIGSLAAANNTALEVTLNSSDLSEDAGYQPIKIAGLPLGLDREFVLKRAWEESTGNFERLN